MSTIYLVMAGEYDEERVDSIYKTLENAEKRATEITLKEGIFRNGECVADKGYVVTRDLLD